MAKVTINGQVFGYDPGRKPMFEALEIERVLRCRFAEWESDLLSGEPSMRAMAAVAWTVLHRHGVQHEGRAMTIEDILSGAYDINLAELTIEAEEGESDPTSPPPDPSPGTAPSTSARSRKSSASGPGR